VALRLHAQAGQQAFRRREASPPPRTGLGSGEFAGPVGGEVVGGGGVAWGWVEEDGRAGGFGDSSQARAAVGKGASLLMAWS
jgi:hypothetical protein